MDKCYITGLVGKSNVKWSISLLVWQYINDELTTLPALSHRPTLSEPRTYFSWVVFSSYYSSLLDSLHWCFAVINLIQNKGTLLLSIPASDSGRSELVGPHLSLANHPVHRANESDWRSGNVKLSTWTKDYSPQLTLKNRKGVKGTAVAVAVPICIFLVCQTETVSHTCLMAWQVYTVAITTRAPPVCIIIANAPVSEHNKFYFMTGSEFFIFLFNWLSLESIQCCVDFSQVDSSSFVWLLAHMSMYQVCVLCVLVLLAKLQNSDSTLVVIDSLEAFSAAGKSYQPLYCEGDGKGERGEYK